MTFIVASTSNVNHCNGERLQFWVKVAIVSFAAYAVEVAAQINEHGFTNAPKRYVLNQNVGDKFKIQCDARIAGFNPDTPGMIVWALSMHRLSDSGCGPREPVLTLAKLIHVNSDKEKEQVYKKITPPTDWRIYAEGARLYRGITNTRTAWVGITVVVANTRDSGIYRCDALVGMIDKSSQHMRRRTSMIYVTVTGPETNVPEKDSPISLYYDRSVVTPYDNHKSVGNTVHVTCAPRLLEQAPTAYFSVSRVHINFMSFLQTDSDFTTVATYHVKNDTFTHSTPSGHRWEFSYIGVDPADRSNINSLRISIYISSTSTQDTGIFECVVVRADNGKLIRGRAGLKVSDVSNIKAGVCVPGDKETVNEQQQENRMNDDNTDPRGGGAKASFLKAPPQIGKTLNRTEQLAQQEAQRKKRQEDEQAKIDKEAEDECVLAAILMVICALMIIGFVCGRLCFMTCCYKKKKKSVDYTEEDNRPADDMVPPEDPSAATDDGSLK